MCTPLYRVPAESKRLWYVLDKGDTADPNVCRPDSRPCSHPTNKTITTQIRNRLWFSNKSPSHDSLLLQTFSENSRKASEEIKKSKD